MKKQHGNDTNRKRTAATSVLNPGTAHKKVKSVFDAFKEGGIIIFNTRTKKYKFVDLP
jgi:hypothetical protein